MKKVNSLKGKKAVEEVYKRGKNYHQKEVRLIVLNREDIKGIILRTKREKLVLNPEIKVGITISRKYGNSVTRNRVKRRIRALCRELLQGVEEGFFIIIRPKDDFKNLSYSKSKEILRLLFIRAGVLY